MFSTTAILELAAKFNEMTKTAIFPAYKSQFLTQPLFPIPEPETTNLTLTPGTATCILCDKKCLPRHKRIDGKYLCAVCHERVINWTKEKFKSKQDDEPSAIQTENDNRRIKHSPNRMGRPPGSKNKPKTNDLKEEIAIENLPHRVIFRSPRGQITTRVCDNLADAKTFAKVVGGAIKIQLASESPEQFLDNNNKPITDNKHQKNEPVVINNNYYTARAPEQTRSIPQQSNKSRHIR